MKMAFSYHATPMVAFSFIAASKQYVSGSVTLINTCCNVEVHGKSAYGNIHEHTSKKEK